MLDLRRLSTHHSPRTALNRLRRLTLAAALVIESGAALAQSPALTKYGPAEMLAESSNLADLTFPKTAVELGMF